LATKRNLLSKREGRAFPGLHEKKQGRISETIPSKKSDRKASKLKDAEQREAGRRGTSLYKLPDANCLGRETTRGENKGNKKEGRKK